MSEPKPRGLEFVNLSNHIATLETYSGRSGRIEGINRIAGAIGENLGIETVDPLILHDTLFTEYSMHGLSSPVIQSCAVEIWTRLQGDQHPLIVRRLFPDQNGDAKTGPRSGNIKSLEDLTAEIGSFYDYFSANYDTTEVTPEIMVHRVIDVGNPPLQEDPFLPYPGGDITPLGNHTYQIRTTFGADESVQGFPHDTWIVKFDPDGSLSVSSPTIEQKTHSVVPAPDEYRHIEIPEDFQNTPSLKEVALIVSLAKVAKNLEDQYGGHRLEFDETIINGKKTLVIIEAAPFEIYDNSYERLRPFGDKIVLPLNLITSSADIHALPSSDLTIAHLPPQMFQGNELRQTLMDLALTAKAMNIPLAVLVSGDIATQHAVRDLIDSGHIVWFTGGEQFESGEKIRLFKKFDGDYDWERENPIVIRGQMQGRGVERIGGKAVGLEKLDKHGFTTPARFILETSLTRRIVEDLGLNEDVTKLDQLSATDSLKEIATFTEKIREAIINLPDNHIPDLEEALSKIGGNLFAVRSSARLEDGQVSLAGIYHTELNVAKEGLRKAILEVLASAFDPLAVKSALAIDVKPSEASIAVIIQTMIQGPATGTIFTKEHLKGDEKVLKIEVARLGSQVVDGTATEGDTQLVWVKKSTREVTKNVMPGSGPILSDDQIEKLMGLGLAIETELDEGPQDIEYAIDEKNNIIILQTRPL